MRVFACFCEVDKELYPLSMWCAPCREAARVRWVVVRLSTKRPVLGADGGLMIFHSRESAVEWITEMIGISEAIGRYAVVESSDA